MPCAAAGPGSGDDAAVGVDHNRGEKKFPYAKSRLTTVLGGMEKQRATHDHPATVEEPARHLARDCEARHDDCTQSYLRVLDLRFQGCLPMSIGASAYVGVLAWANPCLCPAQR